MDDSRYFYALCGIFFAARVLFALWVGTYHYWEDYIIAQNLANGEGYSLWGKPTALKAPIYPLVLLVFIKLFGGSNTLAIVLFQTILLSIVPILISLLGQFIQLPRLGKIAALCFLLHPGYFYYPVVLEITNIFVPASILWSIFLVSYAKSRTPLMAAIFAFFSAALVLIQPLTMPVVTAGLCIVMVRYSRRNTALIAATGLLVLAPWTVRNYWQFSTIIVSKSPVFMNIYGGFFPSDFLENRSTTVTGDSLISRFYIVDKRLAADVFALRQSKNDVEMEPVYRSAVIATVTSHPYAYLIKSAYQAALFFWVPPRYLGDNSIAFWLMRKGPVVLLNVLSVIGVWLLYRRHSVLTVTIVVVLLYFALVYGLTQVHYVRYKLDIEWLQLFLAAACIEKILYWFSSEDDSETVHEEKWEWSPSRSAIT